MERDKEEGRKQVFTEGKVWLFDDIVITPVCVDF